MRKTQIIVLDDDDDHDSDSSGTIENDPDRGYFVHDETPENPTASFNEGDYLTDECFQRLIRDWKSAAAAPQIPQTLTSTSQANESKRVIAEACVDDILYRPGQSVELHDDSFLRIETVLEDTAKNVFLRGRRLVRAYLHPGTYIPPWRNEVIWTVDDDDVTDLPLAIVKRFVPVVFTNWYQPDRTATAILSCRVKETKCSVSTTAAVQYLCPEDADEGYRFDPAAMREDWRGPTRPFGDADGPVCPVINLDVDVDVNDPVDLTEDGPCQETSRDNTRKYTFGDGFCGAGGVSSGASQAGLSIKWAFDHSVHATTTYQLNHTTAVCEQSDVFSFLTNDAAFLRVDVSHGSPPCQTFSPAHTVECASDDANSACIFSCADLIRKAKPRVHTMEETSGLFERHQEVFFRVILDFLELGYSVRWGIVNCMDYGVPQSRRRLIIIASGCVFPVVPSPLSPLPP